MKIYQIHEYYYDWEDSYDSILLSFLSKKHADEYLSRLNDKSSELYKCNDCPLFKECDDCSDDCENCKIGLETVEKYCGRYSPDAENKCQNAEFVHGSNFRIEEVEVIE
jgi:hypothetical protein